MNEEQDKIIKSIDRKLTTLILLEAYKLVNKMTIAEGSPLLKRLGVDSSEIAAVFGTTTGTISTRLSEAKKKSK